VARLDIAPGWDHLIVTVMLRRLAKIVLGLLVVLAVLLALGFRRDLPAAAVEARFATPPSQFVTVHGLRIHYRDRGQGPVVVLLHGSNSSLFTWESWTATLAKDHRVVALDLPGHGLTGPDAKHRYSGAGLAEVVGRFVDQLGLARFTLVGNSMGGNAAWHYTLLHPEKVDHLVLLDSAGLPRDEPLSLSAKLQSSSVFGPIARWVTPHFMVAKTVREVYADPARVQPSTVDTIESLLLRDGNREATRIRRSLPLTDGMEARLGEIKTPTLILWGAQDRWILPKYGERFHQAIPGSTLIVLPGVGHVGMEESPTETLTPTLAFLNSR